MLVLALLLAGCSQKEELHDWSKEIAAATAPAPEPLEVQVAHKFETQYHTLVRTDPVMQDLCSQAGLVKAAWLQANDGEKYKRWDLIERIACGAGRRQFSWIKWDPPSQRALVTDGELP